MTEPLSPAEIFLEVQFLEISPAVYEMLLNNGSLTIPVVKTLKVFSLSMVPPDKRAIAGAKELFLETLVAYYGDQYGVTDVTLLGIRSVLGSHSLYNLKADVSLLIP